MVHGCQALGRYIRYEDGYSADMLYLNGIRLSEKWSSLNMVGVRHTDFGKHGDIVALVIICFTIIPEH